jgi:hypothetical protein
MFEGKVCDASVSISIIGDRVTRKFLYLASRLLVAAVNDLVRDQDQSIVEHDAKYYQVFDVYLGSLAGGEIERSAFGSTLR